VHKEFVGHCRAFAKWPHFAMSQRCFKARIFSSASEGRCHASNERARRRVFVPRQECCREDRASTNDASAIRTLARVQEDRMGGLHRVLSKASGTRW
jgi:hypothetical protein